jgi:hypothetical protein
MRTTTDYLYKFVKYNKIYIKASLYHVNFIVYQTNGSGKACKVLTRDGAVNTVFFQVTSTMLYQQFASEIYVRRERLKFSSNSRKNSDLPTTVYRPDE